MLGVLDFGNVTAVQTLYRPFVRWPTVNVFRFESFAPVLTMTDTPRPRWFFFLTLLCILFLSACDRYRPLEFAAESPRGHSKQPATSRGAFSSGGLSSEVADHEHWTGRMGGLISSLGRDEYHTEAVLQADGKLAVFLLGAEETELCEAPHQILTAYGKRIGSASSEVFLLTPDPLPNDSMDMTSRFAGELPEGLRESSREGIYITVPGLQIKGQRFTFRITIPPAAATDMTMPGAVSDVQAAGLYLTPGGLYTEADIEANQRRTASEKFRDFRARHDANPAPGMPICPITRTKANPDCAWIIGGQTYLFCCPPCIDEFLRIAKETPELIHPAQEYVQQGKAETGLSGSN